MASTLLLLTRLVLSSVGCLTLGAPRARAQDAPTLAAVSIGYVLPDSSDPRRMAFDRGARLGIAEARHAATLLRRLVVVVELSPTDAVGAFEQRLATAAVQVVIAAVVDDALSARLARWAAHPGRAIVASAASARLACSLPLYRTAPDSSARASILASAAAGSGDAARPTGAPAAHIELWHHDLERFGARQLSDRYLQRFGTPMTSEAWEGWFAVKVAWESALRAREGDVAGAIARGAFDGHKGTALRFGPGDRLLRQPLLVMAADPAAADTMASPTRSASRVTGVREIPWPAEPVMGGAAGRRSGSVPCGT